MAKSNLEKQFAEHEVRDEKRFASIHDTVRKEVRESHDSITKAIVGLEQQVKITNGKVSSLDRFRWTLLGMGIVITAIVVPLFLQMINK